LCYAKSDAELENLVVTVVNLDPHHVQSGWVELDLASLGIDANTSYQMHDLLSGARFLWTGPRNFVQLDPQRAPAHVFALRRKVRTERNFDYFL
jgi:starch synthase (maltosyl-transferring)